MHINDLIIKLNGNTNDNLLEFKRLEKYYKYTNKRLTI